MPQRWVMSVYDKEMSMSERNAVQQWLDPENTEKLKTTGSFGEFLENRRRGKINGNKRSRRQDENTDRAA